VPQGSVLRPFLFNVFINDLCNSINYCKYLIFADDLKFFHIINSLHACLLLQSDINSVSDWCTTNSMRLNIAKTRVASYTRKTNSLSYEYQLCYATITLTSSFKDLGVFFDLKLYFQSHVDYLFSACIKLLGLIPTITYRYSSLDCLYVVYFTLVMSKTVYASAVWNTITSTDANKLERIQQKFESVCFYRFLPHVTYSYTFALEKLSLHSLCRRRHHLDTLFFRCIVALNPALPIWKMLVFVFLLAMLGTSQSLVLVPLINTVLLLGAPMLPTL
jgi:hypothetical protein